MNHCHGNHIEMQAMAEMYNRTFEVYQYSTGKLCHEHARGFDVAILISGNAKYPVVVVVVVMVVEISFRICFVHIQAEVKAWLHCH